ncbi:MAG: response regulator [Spirochaetota bacterium]|nr:response regulator [Spirochaetota bacterium]
MEDAITSLTRGRDNSRKIIIRFTICYIIIILLFIAIGPHIFSSDWISSSDFHACIEISSSIIAIIAAIACLIYFFGFENRYFLIIGLGFLICGSEDLIHGIFGFQHLFEDTGIDWATNIKKFIPGTYVAGRSVLAISIIAAALLEDRLKKVENIRGEALNISIIAIMMGGGATALAFVLPLPDFIYPENIISRPVDFISSILFTAAFFLILKRFLFHRDIFSGMLTACILLNIGGQVYMSFSKQLFDVFFDTAHWANILSYTTPVLGIVIESLDEMKKLRIESRKLEEAEHTLARTQTELDQIFNSASPLCAIDNKYNIVRTNDNFCTLFGVEKEDVSHKKCYDVIQSHLCRTAECMMKKIQDNKKDTNKEIEIDNSKKRYLNISANPFFEPDGSLIGIVESITDITERKRVEEDLKASEKKYSNLIEGASVCIFIVQDGVFKYVNSKMSSFTKYSKDELTGMSFEMIIRPDDLPEMKNRYRRRMTGEEVPDIYELTILGKGGIELPVQVNAVLSEYEGRAADVVFLSDISERKRAEKELQQRTREIEKQNWTKTGFSKMSNSMRGNQDIDTLARNIISCIAEYLDLPLGLIYLADEDGVLRLGGSYALRDEENIPSYFRPGEGLIGQAAIDKKDILLTNVPSDYIKINSGLGEAVPQNIFITPVIYNDIVKGVIELGTLDELKEIQFEFVKQAEENIAIAIDSAQVRSKQLSLLHQTQMQAEKLQLQQEELQTTNEELEEQTQKLRASEEELKAQSEELRSTNEELEEKTHSLEKQKVKISQSNIDLENTRKDLEKKANELEITSRYKSEFLANMSHELRTPLNSLLILAQDMVNNKKGNLSNDQVQSAAIIHKSGNDLLILINEILDLSKIESGKITLNIESVTPAEIVESVNYIFRHVLEDKGLKLEIDIAKDLPETIITDNQKLEQIIKNLMSNAVKFTHKGCITFRISKPDPDTDLSRSRLYPAQSIAVSITDTGIGIPENKQFEIFEAFQQVDGSTSREYGGTGLGLSISRELAKLLGGEIQLKSKYGEGSTFTLYIPERLERSERPMDRREPKDSDTQDVILGDMESPKATPIIEDDRDNLDREDRIILTIEDDMNFVKILYNLCHEKNFKFLHAYDGESGLELAEKYKPDAIILDIRLPGIDGWRVLEELKDNLKTRHIPVHIMSVNEETIDAYQKGAVGYLTKPVTREHLDKAFGKIEGIISKKIKDILIVEDDKKLLKIIAKLLGNGDINTDTAKSGKEALKKLKSKTYDCMILDLGLPDMYGIDVLREMERNDDISNPPVIIYTGKDLTQEEEYELQKYASSIIVKGARSEERLLDEISLFLNRVINDMPECKKRMISMLQDKDVIFNDKKILLVDDDMRNVFAISKILEERGMKVNKAANGEKALKSLENDPDIDLVLMDIMMPEMDGYEAMERIRAYEEFRNLPILALTAKAMKEDRNKCIEAGANDYIAKPIEIEKLLSLMRVWLYK